MAKYDSNANESYLLMFESTPLTARGRISGDLWYYDGESARLLEKGIVVTGLQQVTGIGNPFVILETEVSGKKQAAVWTVKDQKCEKLLEDAETIEATKDGVCTLYPAEKTVYDPLVSEWDSAEETVPVYYERTADGFAERSYRELTASEYLAYVSAEDSDEEAQAWKEKLEEQIRQLAKRLALQDLSDVKRKPSYVPPRSCGEGGFLLVSCACTAPML